MPQPTFVPRRRRRPGVAPDSLALAIVDAAAMGLEPELERRHPSAGRAIARAVTERLRAGRQPTVCAPRWRARRYGGGCSPRVEAWAHDGAGAPTLDAHARRARVDTAAAVGSFGAGQRCGGFGSSRTRRNSTQRSGSIATPRACRARSVRGRWRRARRDPRGGERDAGALELRRRWRLIDRIETDSGTATESAIALEVDDAAAAVDRLVQGGCATGGVRPRDAVALAQRSTAGRPPTCRSPCSRSSAGRLDARAWGAPVNLGDYGYLRHALRSSHRDLPQPPHQGQAQPSGRRRHGPRDPTRPAGRGRRTAGRQGVHGEGARACARRRGKQGAESRGQQVVQIVNEELVAILGGPQRRLQFA